MYKSRESMTKIFLLAILVLALGLRLYGINWDSGYGFHPDERSIYMQSDCMYRLLSNSSDHFDCVRDYPDTELGFPNPRVFFDSDRSPLNPHWFPLGSLLIYVMVGFRFILELFTDVGALQMSYIGRTLSSLADVGTVLMIFVVGKRMYGIKVGMLAAGLLSLAVIHIQSSHFYRPETFLSLLVIISYYLMLKVSDGRRLKHSILLGLVVGLGIAIKVSMLPLLMPVVFVYGRWALDTATFPIRRIATSERSKLAVHVGFATVAALMIFALTTPYAFIDMAEFIRDTTWEASIARTAGKMPYTIQYIGVMPLWYEIRQLTLWGLGLPLGIVAWAGLLFAALKAGTRGSARYVDIMLLLWVVPNLILLSTFDVKFLRYTFPVVAILVLMGSRMLIALVDWGSTIRNNGNVYGRTLMPKIACAIMGCVIAATAFYAIAFEMIYKQSHPAIKASQWMKSNISYGSSIITDNHWDDGIPELYKYNVWQVPIYDDDTKEKMGKLAKQLAESDYLVFYSNRTYGSVTRVPERYPLSARYYQLLFAGELGYEPHKVFSSYPRWLGVAFRHDPFTRLSIRTPQLVEDDTSAWITLNLGYADDNVANYDHPLTLLFKNEEHLSRDELADVLMENVSFIPTERDPSHLMLSSEMREIQQKGGTWSEIINRDSWTNRFPVLAWLLLLEVIAIAALPLSLFLFSPLSDRGMVFARLLGILICAYVAWLLASLGWVSFSRVSLFAGLTVLATLSTVILVTQWKRMTLFIRNQWKTFLIGETVFFAAFLIFLLIRIANPDLWHPFRGGEKAMDFAYLNAVLKSTYMPPFDPWFSGGYLNYYYWGQFVVATLVKATGILPATAYNLAIPLFFSLTVTAAYGLVYNIAAGFLVTLNMPSQGVSDTHLDDSYGASGRLNKNSLTMKPIGAGLCGAIFVGIIGNLDGAVQVVKGIWFAYIGPFVTGALWFIETLDRRAFPSFDFWRSSRMIPPQSDIIPSAATFWIPERIDIANCGTASNVNGLCGDVSHHITEFPFFSFLFGDLHAHVMAIPFSLLALALGLSLLIGLKSNGIWWSIMTTVVLAITLGSLWAINSWDYPTYALFTAMFVVCGVYVTNLVVRRKLLLAGFLLMLLICVSLLAFLPFHLLYKPSPVGLLVSKWQTPIVNFLGIHGLFLFLSGSFVACLTWPKITGWLSTCRTNLFPIQRLLWLALLRDRWNQAVIIALVLCAIIYMIAVGYWTVALMLAFLSVTVVAGWSVLQFKERWNPYILAPLAFLGFACLLTISVEFVRLDGDIGRMNTVFKYYMESWVLFAIASSIALFYMWNVGLTKMKRVPWVRRGWFGMMVILAASSFIYPVLGTIDRVSDRFHTEFHGLDGSAYMKDAQHFERGKTINLSDDYGAIRWLQDNVEGSPVILEAQDEQYEWASRISDYTGLPTVLGWRWHQLQQRAQYVEGVNRRHFMVREIYSTENIDRALELLKQYNVEYVVVGALERAYYTEVGMTKFRTLVESGLAELVYEKGETKVYRGLW